MAHQVDGGVGGGTGGRPVRRALRRLLLGGGPLKRRSDRVEMVSRLALLAVVLVAVPVSLAVGTVARSAVADAARAQAAERHQVTAVLVEDTTHVTLGSAGDRQFTLARWTTPDGRTVEDRVPAPVGATAGQEVTIWIDADGARTRAPLNGSEVTDRALVRGALVFLSVTAVALTAHGAVCLVLARRRARQWDAGWAAVEPQWADRRRPGADSLEP
ncbi:hypothetical protein [Modestobacter sp. NPDC049651]|uniref:Rv1733c family protein n=1 Tax=unclassified Modestobacter TaxID=2643866 RepID=UPI0033E22F74